MANPTSKPAKSAVAPPIFGHHGPRFQTKTERAKDARGTVGRLWRYLGRQRLALVVTCCMVVTSVGLDLTGPYLMKVALDRYIIPGNLAGLGRLCLLMMAIYLSSSLLNWLQVFVMTGASQRTIRDIRADLFGKLQRLPLPYFDRSPHGDLMSRLSNDVDSINQVLSGSVTQLLSGALSVVGVAFAMFILNARLAIVRIATITFMTLVINRWIAARIREYFRKQQSNLGKLNGYIEEVVSAQQVVKAFNQEFATIERFEVANLEYRASATKAQTIAGLIGPIMNVIGNTGLAIVAGTGGALAVRGLATVGCIAAFINYTRQFSRPLNDFANLYNSIQSAMAGAERVFEVIDEKPETDVPEATPVNQISGEVHFNDVTFSYVEGTPILKHVNLHAKPGETVALIGPTGAGKTTIVNLLTRFYAIDEGQITVDGRDINLIPRDDLRRRLGIVLQDTFLFAGTVRDNIRYGRLDATNEEIESAANLANANHFIKRLPQGYDTELTERGGNLSHGQRQLLAIARAILADPAILILDEATSSVDTRTERHIQEAMKRLMAGRTSFVIAHRLSTIRDADQILAINHGEIVERGTHAELLALRGFYYRLYTSHFETNTDLDIEVGQLSVQPG